MADMSGLVSTDFAMRGGAAMTSFDVFKAGPKNEKNLKDQLEAGNPKEALQAMKRIIKVSVQFVGIIVLPKRVI